MFDILQVVTVLLVAVAMAYSRICPGVTGKMRLTKDIYDALQPIYYPGLLSRVHNWRLR